MAHNCDNCPMRAKYDKLPNSLMGRFWRWHINFCPGWKGYIRSLSPDEQDKVREKYHFYKYEQHKK